jgi:hypothetical protein
MVAFIDEAREGSDRQIVVLIPVVVPEHFRYRILHNQVDVVLSAALRTRTDIVVARVPLPLAEPSDASGTEELSDDVSNRRDHTDTTPLSDSPH